MLEIIARFSQGDCRTALNTLEILVESASSEASGGTVRLTRERLESVFQGRLPDYDRDGEGHFNLISALHKSVRGSDPDASLYWLARMLEGGEDPQYIARRLLRIASEDVGMADPQALVIASAAQEAVHFLGMPEGDLALAQTVVYLATAPEEQRAVHRVLEGQGGRARVQRGPCARCTSEIPSRR